MELVSRFSRAKGLVLDIYAVNLVTAKRCSQLQEQPRLVELEKDTACFQDAPSSLIKEYANQVLRPDSNIPESREVVAASKVF